MPNTKFYEQQETFQNHQDEHLRLARDDDENWLDDEDDIEALNGAFNFEQGPQRLFDEEDRALHESKRKRVSEVPIRPASPSASGSWKKAKSPAVTREWTLAQRVEILNWHQENGKSTHKTAQHFNSIDPNLKLGQQQVSRWVKNENKWRNRLEQEDALRLEVMNWHRENGSIHEKTIFHFDAIYPNLNLERRLYDWVKKEGKWPNQWAEGDRKRKALRQHEMFDVPASQAMSRQKRNINALEGTPMRQVAWNEAGAATTPNPESALPKNSPPRIALSSTLNTDDEPIRRADFETTVEYQQRAKRLGLVDLLNPKEQGHR